MEPHAKMIHLLSNLPGMQDFRSGVHLCSLLFQTEGIPGDVVEMGCWKGHVAALFTALTDRKVWVYDSFKGLPLKTKHDITRCDFMPGYLASPQEDLVQYFRDHELRLPTIVPKWFAEVLPNEIPEMISFAHIDADFWTSTMDALKLVYPRLSKGAACIIHDYGTEILQGVKPAVDTFLTSLPPADAPQSASPMSPDQFCIRR